MSRDLFESQADDEPYGLFWDARTMHLFNSYNTELLEIVAKQKLKYWRVEREYSDTSDIYGESDSKSTRTPVNVYCWIMLDQPETETGQYTTEIKRRIEAYMHKDRLTEQGIVPRIGDYLEWDNQYFEIIAADVPNFVYGMPQTKLGVILKAISVREDVFSGDRDPEIDELNSDSESPY